MQSWGTQSRFPVRDTEREPSKSGVVGLLCAALGRPRHLPVDDLAALRTGVRVEAEGSVAVDFQTAGGTHRRGDRYGVLRAEGTPGETVVSRRYYLADADFLVGLEGPTPTLLEEISAALARPVWALSLGRKAFVPGLPVRLPDGGVRRDRSLEEALMGEPWPLPL
ncbi:MAG: type I-E CRISPR-associated protein Cas5/CasD, partial [Chloroflexia bacterium]|nr:type I-E CRISPR-associated protein Cas5/CasD [Chloroflexia bacterium]